MAQLAQPVQRSRYQLNSSPRNLGCCGMRSSTEANPTIALSAIFGSENAYLSTFLSASLARPNTPILRSGYWCTVNMRLGSTMFFMVIARPLTSPRPYIV